MAKWIEVFSNQSKTNIEDERHHIEINTDSLKTFRVRDINCMRTTEGKSSSFYEKSLSKKMFESNNKIIWWTLIDEGENWGFITNEEFDKLEELTGKKITKNL